MNYFLSLIRELFLATRQRYNVNDDNKIYRAPLSCSVTRRKYSKPSFLRGLSSSLQNPLIFRHTPGILERHKLGQFLQNSVDPILIKKKEKKSLPVLLNNLTRRQLKALPLLPLVTVLHPELGRRMLLFEPASLLSDTLPATSPTKTLRPKYPFRPTPDRGLADIFSYWALDLMKRDFEKSPLELMLSMSLLLGLFAFWELVPQYIITIDPTVVLSPIKLSAWKQFLNECPLTRYDPDIVPQVHDLLTENRALQADLSVEQYRVDMGKRALAYTLAAFAIGIMLNAVCTSHITHI